MRSALAAGLLLVAGYGCASPQPPPPPPPPTAIVTPAPEPAPAQPPDTCGLAAHRQWVGRRRAEIPVPLRPEFQRVACETCPITQDHNERRLNFFFDAASGRITRISCG